MIEGLAQKYEAMAEFELGIGTSPQSYIVKYYRRMGQYWRGA